MKHSTLPGLLLEWITARLAGYQFYELNAKAQNVFGGIGFREVDRALQKLRRDGKIKYDKHSRVWRAI